MAATLDAISTLAEVLTQHGPLRKDEITQHARDRGMDDPDSAIQWNMLEMDCPARQLVDDRWVWLPAVLAGRVFTHRLSAEESTHDVLTVTPDLDPITTLCEHAQYQRLADGSSARVVLDGYDDELLDERNIPSQAIDPAGALLLKPGALAALGVGDGDTVGVRLATDGLVLERVDVITQHTAGEGLSATLGADEPTYADAGRAGARRRLAASVEGAAPQCGDMKMRTNAPVAEHPRPGHSSYFRVSRNQRCGADGSRVGDVGPTRPHDARSR